jgi:hypothetical protein
VVGAYRANGKDFDIGRRAARMLRDAGLEDVRVRPTARVTKVGDYHQTFLLTLATLVGDQITAGGTLTPEELETSSSALRAHLGTPGTVTCQPLIWQAWGRKPKPKDLR